MKYTGKVFWFNEVEGRGILLNSKGERIYVHYSAIVTNAEFKTLRRDEPVEFELYSETGFLQAKKVKVLKAKG